MPRRGLPPLLAVLGAAHARESWPVWPYTHFSSCPQMCCCKACSDPGHPSFPYGILVDGGLDTISSGGPTDPKLEGDLELCQIPTWHRASFLVDFAGVVPNTIWWTESTVFGDSVPHVAPSTCDCCRWSGVHQDCTADAPPATRPADWSVAPEHESAGAVQPGAVHTQRPARLIFFGGVELGPTNIAELRNNTHCGYSDPPPTLRGYVNTTNGRFLGPEAAWDIPALPEPGCYRVCYFHSTLTTPTWYDMGNLDVIEPPGPPTEFSFADDEVILENLEVTFLFTNRTGYSIFDDVAELRIRNGTCGEANPERQSAATSTTLRLNPEPGYAWCQPPLAPTVSPDRPLRYMPFEWTDCPVRNRLPVPSVRWTVTLPAAGTYYVCYKHHDVGDSPAGALTPGLWFEVGSLVVPAVQTVASALAALYAATGGAQWYHQSGWLTAPNPCDWYGIACDETKTTVQMIFLARNNLVGTIPELFTQGAFQSVTVLTLESNKLSGTLPHSIGHWSSLRSLDLGYNRIQGSIPMSLTRCPLRSLYLSNNVLEGDLPLSLRSLVTLRAVYTEGAAPLTPLEVPQPIKYLTQADVPSRCPEDDSFCPVTGGVTAGVSQCGHDAVTEETCVQVLGCCWNVYVGQGRPCFTRKKFTFHTHPQCTAEWCFPQPDVAS